MFASLVEAVVEDDDSLEVGARVDFPVAVLSHLSDASCTWAINIVISSLQGLLRSTAIRSGTFWAPLESSQAFSTSHQNWRGTATARTVSVVCSELLPSKLGKNTTYIRA